MTTKEAIRELKIVRNYCNAKSIPAIDYAIRALREKAEQEAQAPEESRSERPGRFWGRTSSGSGQAGGWCAPSPRRKLISAA